MDASNSLRVGLGTVVLQGAGLELLASVGGDLEASGFGVGSVSCEGSLAACDSGAGGLEIYLKISHF